jgi:type IV secretion system protein VirD4
LLRLLAVGRLLGIAMPVALWFASRQLGSMLATGTTLYSAALTAGPLVVACLLTFLYGSIGRLMPALSCMLAFWSGILGIELEITRWTTSSGTYSVLDVLIYLDWPLILVSLLCLGLPVYLFAGAMGLGWRPGLSGQASKLFGSSRWMSLREAKRDLHGGELVIGEAYDATLSANMAGRAQLLTIKGDGHLLTVGGAGSGKTRSVAIPNCLTWTGSLVALDPKGELHRTCKKARVAMGHQVVIFNPDDPSGDSLDILGWLDERDPRLIADVDLIVSWIIEGVSDSGANKVFEEQAKALLSTVIIDTLADPTRSPTDRNVGAVFRRLGGDQVGMTLAEIADHGKAFPFYPFDIIAPAAKGFIEQREDAAETWQGVMLYVQSSLGFLRSPGNMRVLSGNSRSVSLDALPAGSLDVFIAVPLRILDTSPAVARLIVGSLISIVLRQYENTGQRADKDVLFLLDEMPRLRKMAILETARDAGRGYGIRLWGIVQDFGQLKQWYGENGLLSWLANSRVQTFMGVSDPETAGWLSDRMGTTTGLAKNWRMPTQAETPVKARRQCL